MSELNLDDIRTDIEAHRAELPVDTVCCVGCHIALTDVPALLAEVERLTVARGLYVADVAHLREQLRYANRTIADREGADR